MLVRVQILRAIAAYMIVVYHAIAFLGDTTHLPFPTGGFGAAGVDIFFVVSGFIMVHITRDNVSPGAFMLSRFIRIAPLYWLATGLALMTIWLVPWSFQHAIVDGEHLLKSLAFIPVMDGRGAYEPILFVGWTLNFEMAFYALFALSLFLPRFYRLPALIVALTALYLVGYVSPVENPLRFYGYSILFEFAAGCLIGAALQNPRMRSVLDRVPAWPLVILGTAAVLATTPLIESPAPRILVGGVPAMLIVLGVVLLDLRRPISGASLAVRLGDASYSAYLLHPMVGVVVGVVVIRLLGEGLFASIVLILGNIVATAMVSLLSFRLVEKPMIRLFRSMTAARVRA